MRILRRGVIAQRKAGGYVWAVYSLVAGVDESVYTTGSFNMTASFGSTPSLMAADGYTVDSSGKITLTSAVKTNVSALTAGKYIVSISSSSSTTTTSTQYVYKVTSVTSSGDSWNMTYTVSYERYEVSLSAKGEATGETVEADEQIYPLDGIWNGDGRWYELVAGWITIHVWNLHSIKTTTVYESVVTTPGGGSDMVTVPVTKTIAFSDDPFTFNASTGKYIKPSNCYQKVLATGSESVQISGYLARRYWAIGSGSSFDTVYYGCSGGSGNPTVTTTVSRIYSSKASTEYSKGAATGEIAEAVTNTAFPTDGQYGDYWYVYSHSYEGYYDIR